MINRYVDERVLLPRPLPELYENVWEFTVAEEAGRVTGCGALKFYDADIAEIRSLCVEPGGKSHGIGRALTESLLAEAERFGLKTVFALTLTTEFFKKCGFREVTREQFPMKVWRDCLACPKFSCCDEKAVVFDLVARQSTNAAARPETAEVPA